MLVCFKMAPNPNPRFYHHAPRLNCFRGYTNLIQFVQLTQLAVRQLVMATVCRLIFWTLPPVEFFIRLALFILAATLFILFLWLITWTCQATTTERDEQRATHTVHIWCMSARKGTLRMCMYIDIYIYILQMYIMNDYNYILDYNSAFPWSHILCTWIYPVSGTVTMTNPA